MHRAAAFWVPGRVWMRQKCRVQTQLKRTTWVSGLRHEADAVLLTCNQETLSIDSRLAFHRRGCCSQR